MRLQYRVWPHTFWKSRVKLTITLEAGRSFGLAKVAVAELLGRGGSFRCWLCRLVEPSCNTVIYEDDDKQTLSGLWGLEHVPASTKQKL